MYDLLREQHMRPEPYSRYTAATLWTDPHISARMLAHHLDPETDISSRRATAIDGIVDWIDRAVGLAGKRFSISAAAPAFMRRAWRSAAHPSPASISRNAPSPMRARRRQKAGFPIDYRHQDYLAGDLPADRT